MGRPLILVVDHLVVAVPGRKNGNMIVVVVDQAFVDVYCDPFRIFDLDLLNAHAKLSGNGLYSKPHLPIAHEV